MSNLTDRRIRIEKSKPEMPVAYLTIDTSVFKSRKSAWRASRTISSEERDLEERDQEESRTKVYLYMKLLKVNHVPIRTGSMELQLHQARDSIRKIESHYTNDTTVKLKDLHDYMPTFSITVVQDSFTDVNAFSDNPLIITLYERSIEEVEVDEEPSGEDAKELGKRSVLRETLIPVGQTLVDLLQFFTRQRSSQALEVFLYPNQLTHAEEATCKIALEFYTLLPLLKEIRIANIIFITLESIYNLSSLLMDVHAQLKVRLFVRTSSRSSKKSSGDVEICTFQMFTRSIIIEQDPHIIWESAKHSSNGLNSSLGLQTGNAITLHRLFRQLFCTEGVDFSFKEINTSQDEALVCNSLHRFVLDDALMELLTSCVGYNEETLVLQLCFVDGEVILEGIVDFSIFLYPLVNAMRFAVELRTINNASRRTSRKSGRTSRLTRQSQNASFFENPQRPIFAILNICLLSPINEIPMKVSNNGALTQNQMRACIKRELDISTSGSGKQIIIGEIYSEFDETMLRIIRNIIDCEIVDFDSQAAKKFFCANLDEVRGKVFNLIALDFNQRIKTKDNIEFTRLMTTVYKDLVQRIYNLINKMSTKLPKMTKRELIERISTIKLLFEAGNAPLANLLLEKLKEDNTQSSDFTFSLFLYDVEKQDFEKAKELLETKTVKASFIYFVNFIEIYIKYKEELDNEESNEESSNEEAPKTEALENLLANLKTFIGYYPTECDGWILLYCLYKNSNYVPGMSLARWRYEAVCDTPQIKLPQIPKSRWEIYFNYTMPIQRAREKLFYHAFQTFVRLGMYTFAEYVLPEFKNELTPQEYQYLVITLNILLGKQEFTTNKDSIEVPVKPFSMDASKLMQVQVNGNWEYFRGNKSMAAVYYGAIVFLTEDTEIISFDEVQLSLLRHGYMSLNNGEFDQAIQAFERLCFFKRNCIHAAFGLGLAHYKNGNWKEAEHYFGECTEAKSFIPDIWGYLAIVNLKMGHTANALNCWIYAHIDPKKSVSDEILLELSKIDLNSVDMYVDRPRMIVGQKSTRSSNT